jgi:ketosteroid isomerase-like protein
VVDDVTAIRNLVDEIDDTSDRKDWEACRLLFADVVEVDFTSLTGDEPASLPADALIDTWRENLHEDKPSFHLQTHHRIHVDGDTATCVSHGYALNVLRREGGDDDLWEVWGWYTHVMQRFPDGWRCTGMKIDVLHTRGNAEAVQPLPPDA